MRHTIRCVFLLIVLAPIISACGSQPLATSYGVGIYMDSLTQAVKYVGILSKSGNLPGFQKEDRATASINNVELTSGNSETLTFNFPISVEVEVVKETEKEFVYRYLLNKQDLEEPWVIVKGWKTNSTGKVVEDSLKLPSPEIQKTISRGSKI